MLLVQSPRIPISDILLNRSITFICKGIAQCDANRGMCHLTLHHLASVGINLLGSRTRGKAICESDLSILLAFVWVLLHLADLAAC